MADQWQMSRFLEDFKSTVFPSLKSGIGALNALASILLDTNADIITKDTEQFRKIRSRIEEVKNNFSQSERAAGAQLTQADKLTETLTARRGKLERQQEKKYQKIENLEQMLKSNRAILEVRQHSLDKALQQKRDAQWKLQDLQDKMEEAEAIRNAGIGLAFIPIIGWIAGGVMIGVGQADLDQASWAAEQAEQAEQEVDALESQINSIKWDLSNAERQISQVRGEISQVHSDLELLLQDLSSVKHQRTNLANFQSQMRNTVNLLGRLAGTASVAEVQMRVSVLLGPVIRVLENVTDLAGQITQRSLLYDPTLTALISALQQNHHKLRAVEANKDSSACQDYW